MRKIVTALIAAVCIAAMAMASSNTAQARWGGGGGWHGSAGFGGGWRGGGGWHGAGVWHGGPGFGGWHGGWHRGFPFGGVAAGLAAGAILGGILGAPYGYGGYYPGYAVAPDYGYGDVGYYGHGGGCYLTQVWGPYGPSLAQVCY